MRKKIGMIRSIKKNIERKFNAQYNENCNVLGLYGRQRKGKRLNGKIILLRKEELEETRVVLCKENL